MDRQQRKGTRKAASGGNVRMLADVAFFCHFCQIQFSDIDNYGFHMLTEHPSDSDLADDDTKKGAPPSFVEDPDFGPRQSDFTPHDPDKIQRMLEDRIGGPETVEMPVIPPPLFPPSQNFFGEWRGTEGKCNSCYLDVFCMLFAFSTAFDGIFTQEALNTSIFLRIVLFEVVIPLRTRMYVKRDVVSMLRTLLADATMNKEYLTNTWDFTEFLMDLVKQVDFSNVCNFIGDTIACGFLIQLAGIQDRVLSLQQLLVHNIHINRITFSSPPKAFVLRVRPDLISEPPLCLPLSTVSLNGCSYRLSAIICMSRSHYTGFYMSNGMWVFFDSMRNSVGGHCVPLITPVPGFQEYLDSGCNEQFLSEKNDGESRDLYDDRVRRGAFAFIFTREEIVPVLPPRIQGSSAVLPSGLAKFAPSSRKPSTIGGGAAAVPAQTSPSCRKQHSARGGGAAVLHQYPLSFGHAQPTFESHFVISASSLCDSVFSTPDGFLKAIQQIVQQTGGCPKHFQVTGLNIPSSCAQSIQLYGSFPVSTKDHKNYYPYRGTTFVFADGSVKKYDDSVDSLSIPQNKGIFSGEILKHWCNSNRVLVEIHFERCALKPIPSE
jgi:hypothetical protein